MSIVITLDNTTSPRVLAAAIAAMERMMGDLTPTPEAVQPEKTATKPVLALPVKETTVEPERPAAKAPEKPTEPDTPEQTAEPESPVEAAPIDPPVQSAPKALTLETIRAAGVEAARKHGKAAVKVNRSKLDIARARACMSRKELAAASGISFPTINRAFTGCSILPETLGLIARALNCEPAELVDEEPSSEDLVK